MRHDSQVLTVKGKVEGSNYKRDMGTILLSPPTFFVSTEIGPVLLSPPTMGGESNMAPFQLRITRVGGDC